MKLVLQNPLIRLIRSYGWAVLLIAVSLAVIIGGLHALTAAGVVAGLLAGAAAGLMGMGAARVKRAVDAVEGDRRAKGLSFVCPHCLIAQTPTRACPGCRRPLPLEQVVTCGEVLRTCAGCRNGLTPDALEAGRAACSACGQSGEGQEWLSQTDRVVGTLSEADFNTVGALLGGAVQVDRGIRYLRGANGNETLFVLCLGDLANSRSELPAHHAAASLSAVWVDQVDALAGTEALDRLAQRAGLAPAALKRIELWAAGTALDPAAERAFTVRLGELRFGVTPRSFLDPAETPAGPGGVPAPDRAPLQSEEG